MDETAFYDVFNQAAKAAEKQTTEITTLRHLFNQAQSIFGRGFTLEEGRSMNGMTSFDVLSADQQDRLTVSKDGYDKFSVSYNYQAGRDALSVKEVAKEFGNFYGRHAPPRLAV